VKTRPRVLVVAAGGTISSRRDKSGLGVATLSANDVLAGVPEAYEVAEITAIDVGLNSSRAITPSDMCLLAHEIDAAVRAGCDGAVVTHGTDTLEETAYALALQLQVDVPVALTGAMRLSEEPGADGPANLLAALRVAVTPGVAELGPVVVIHDEVHLARFVAKSHTSRVAAFSSPGFGPVGYVGEGRVYLFARPLASDYLGLPEQLDGRVELIWVATGTDGLLVDAAASWAQGIVVAGTGGGHVPPAMVDSLRTAVEHGLPVILASRTGVGPLLEHTYGGIGSETHLLSLGVRQAGILAPLKARLRLLVALALGKSVDEVFPI
jgi:L-asparaginase